MWLSVAVIDPFDYLALWVYLIQLETALIIAFAFVLRLLVSFSAVLGNKITCNVLCPIRTNILVFYFGQSQERKLKQLVTCCARIFPRLANYLASVACFSFGFSSPLGLLCQWTRVTTKSTFNLQQSCETFPDIP